MTLPDDFGLSPEKTLAHVGDPTPAPIHSPFWSHWNHAVYSTQPELRRRSGPSRDASDLTADLEFESLRRVRIGCRLALPSATVRGGVVVLHGYARPRNLAEDVSDWLPLVERGVAVLGVRVRGYPGSRLDVGPVSESASGFAVHGFEGCNGKHERTMDWIMPQAVADGVNAYRALRRRLGASTPISLAGESFGAALALIATAQLSLRDDPDRLVLSVPSMGDWPWRLRHHAAEGGVGGDVQSMLKRIEDGEPARTQHHRDALRALDGVVHAAKVRCPVLCKLAERDDQVPAPTAAAVYNALGTDPGLKWRFTVPFGHFDGGLPSARRHALFARCALEFLSPLEEGESLPIRMRRWEPLLSGGESDPE